MRGLRRLAGALLFCELAAAVVSLPGCSSSDRPTYRIAILRAIPSTSSDAALYQGLARGGVARAQVRIVGGSAPTEAHPDAAGAAAAVRQWVKDGAQAIVAL